MTFQILEKLDKFRFPATLNGFFQPIEIAILATDLEKIWGGN